MRKFSHRTCRMAAKLIVDSGADLSAMAKHLEPVVKQRLDMQRLHGFDWPGKPVRALSALN